MKKRPIKWQACLGTMILAIGSTVVFAADIYHLVRSDGTDHFASQALDSTYEIYLKEEPNPLISPLASHNSPARKSPQQTALVPIIDRIAKKHAVDAALVRAIIDTESRSNANAVSAKGAVGVMQLMPATAARYGVTQRTDPTQNIEAGVRYLKDLLVLHHGNVALALASYNAGEGTVSKSGRRIPPYKETMLYVPAVMSRLEAARNTTP